MMPTLILFTSLIICGQQFILGLNLYEVVIHLTRLIALILLGGIMILVVFHYIRKTLTNIFLKCLSIFKETRAFSISLQLVNHLFGLATSIHISDIWLSVF
jgi:hypothetical protein